MIGIQWSDIDLGIGIFLAVMGVIGFIQGILKQIVGICALILASITAVIVPLFVRFPEMGGKAYLWSYLLLGILIWIPAYLVTSMVLHFFINKFSSPPRFGGRCLGLIFGIVKGAIIIGLFIMLIDSLPISYQKIVPQVYARYSESRMVSILTGVNPFTKIRIFTNLYTLLKAISDPSYMELLKKDRDFRRLIETPTIKAVLKDKEIRELLEDRRYAELVSNPKIKAIFRDKTTLQLLLTTDIDDEVIPSSLINAELGGDKAIMAR